MKNSSIPAILIWVLYGLTAGCCLFLTAMTISSNLGFGVEAGLAVGGVVLVILGGGAYGIRRLREKKAIGGSNTVDSGRQMIGVIVESLLVVLMLIGMVFLRAMFSSDQLPWTISADPAFELAKVVQGEALPNIMHRGRELYIYMLRGCMFLLGNKPQAAVILQLVLLVPTALGLYFGVRRNAGKIPAVTVVAFLGFGPYMLVETCRLSAFLPVVFIYGLAVGCIAKVPGGSQEHIALRVVNHLLSGILIGICCYLDMSGITLLVILTGRICFHIGDAEDEETGHAVLSYIACVLVAGLFYFICHLIRSADGGNVVDSVVGQLELYLPGSFRFPVTVDLGMTLWDLPLLAALLAIGIFTFWFNHRIAGKGVWLFTAAVLMLMQCFQMNETNAFNSYALLYLLCAVMAGISIEDLFYSPAVAVTKAGDELEIIDPGEESDMESTSAQASKNESKNDQAAAAPEKPQIKYIENPLPLPKKKAHKAMDYDYEVAEDDDFDIP